MSVFEIGFYEFLLEKQPRNELENQIYGMVANAYVDNTYMLYVFLRFRGFHSKEP